FQTELGGALVVATLEENGLKDLVENSRGVSSEKAKAAISQIWADKGKSLASAAFGNRANDSDLRSLFELGASALVDGTLPLPGGSSKNIGQLRTNVSKALELWRVANETPKLVADALNPQKQDYEVYARSTPSWALPSDSGAAWEKMGANQKLEALRAG